MRSPTSAPRRTPPARYHFDLATADDDLALRALLREIEMPGSVRLTYEREPSYFAADPPLGETVQTLVAREHPRGPAVALASRATRTVFIGGEPTRIGYLSGLRVHPAHQGRAVLGNGWSALRELHRADPVPWYLVSVTAENERARRLLTLGRGDAPRLVPLADVVTLALLTHRWARQVPPESAPLRLPILSPSLRGTDERPKGSEAGDPRDLFPATPPDLPGAGPEAEVVTPSASGILWNPSAVRQTVVRRYDGVLARGRPAANLALRAIGARPLPSVGEAMRSAFLVGVQAQDASAYDALLGTALAQARRDGLAFVLVGHDISDPYLGVARRRLHVPYRSTLFAAHWPDGAPPRLRRPLHTEIATY